MSSAVKIAGVLVVLLALAEPMASERIDREFHAALERRGAKPQWELYTKYVADRFAASSGMQTFSDKTGNCRLPWIEHLLVNPTRAVDEADRFTRETFQSAADREGLAKLLTVTAERMAVTVPPPVDEAKPNDPLTSLAAILGRVHRAVTLAQQPLSEAELTELRANLYEQTTAHPGWGHRFADPAKGRRVTDLVEKLDRGQYLAAARALADLTRPQFLDSLARLPRDGRVTVAGAKGDVLLRVDSPQGTILVGGPGANEYDLERLGDVWAVVDLGGDDVYLNGATTAKRPVLVLLDLAGDDTYRGDKPSIQGAAILGASLLVDRAGNDKYQAGDVAQGSTLAGVGLLIDESGDDTYRGDRRVQGQAIAGWGCLIDRDGNDDYRGALLAQGVGGPLGCGVLADRDGRDHYFAGGKYPDPYDDTPGFGGWSQGVGIGPRGVANGGLGLLLDGGGDDVYEADYFSHGGGYWFAAGFARDFGGHDQRLGATRENFDGTPRTEPRFLRWGVGYGCHYAAGFLFDDDGNDLYQADFAGVCFSWDIALAVLCDTRGNDRYLCQGSGTSQSHNAAVALLFDGDGDDEYRGSGLGQADAKSEYHPLDRCGGNFALLLDVSGKDVFGQDLKNGTDVSRGWAGGIFLDLPGTR